MSCLQYGRQGEHEGGLWKLKKGRYLRKRKRLREKGNTWRTKAFPKRIHYGAPPPAKKINVKLSVCV